MRGSNQIERGSPARAAGRAPARGLRRWGAAAPLPARLAAASQPSPLDVDRLLDWAEATYPSLFPRSDHTFTRASPDYTYYYREYPPTGNDLGVSGQDVYVRGPVAGAGVRRVGTIADYECDALPEACWPGATIEAGRRLAGAWVSYGVDLPSRAYVIRSAQDWTTLWQGLHGPASAPPPVDFATEVVVGGANGWGGGCGDFGALQVLRQGSERLLWGQSWTPPLVACPAIETPQVAFLALAQPVTEVQFVHVNACWHPLPIAGFADPQLRTLAPDAPAYVVAFNAGVDPIAETARLAAVYGFTAKDVGAAGFRADFVPPVLAQMRCEPALRSIAHNRAS